MNAALSEMVDGLIDVLLQDPEFTFFPILERCSKALSEMNSTSVRIYVLFLVRVAESWSSLDRAALSTLLKCFLRFLQHLTITSIASMQVEHGEKGILNESLVKADDTFKCLFKLVCEAGAVDALDSLLSLLPSAPVEILQFVWRNYVKAFASRMENCPQSVTAWTESIRTCCQNDPKLAGQASSCLIYLLHGCMHQARGLPTELLASFVTASVGIHSQLQSRPEAKDKQARLAKELSQLLLDRTDLIHLLPAESMLFWSFIRECRNKSGGGDGGNFSLPQLKNVKRVGRLLCNASSGLIGGLAMSGSIQVGSTLFMEQVLRAGIGWRQLLYLLTKAQVNDDLLLRSQLQQALKLALLSRGLDELNEIGVKELSQGINSLGTCLLLTVFPFSLLPRLDGQLVDSLVSELCFSMRNSFRKAGNELLAEALANIVAECFDSLKPDKVATIVSVLPAVNSGKALHKLIRPLLQLRDASLLNILDASVQRCSFVDACYLLRLMPFLKTLRDPERTARSIIDKFDRLVPRALTQATNPLLNHCLLHSLYMFLKYSTDVSCITRPFLKAHTEALAVYAQGFIPAWPRGEFTLDAEDSIWSAIEQAATTTATATSASGRRAKICIEVDGDVGAVLKAAVKRLQGKADKMVQSGDEEAMKRLTAMIQRIII